MHNRLSVLRIFHSFELREKRKTLPHFAWSAW